MSLVCCVFVFVFCFCQRRKFFDAGSVCWAGLTPVSFQTLGKQVKSYEWTNRRETQTEIDERETNGDKDEKRKEEGKGGERERQRDRERDERREKIKLCTY